MTYLCILILINMKRSTFRIDKMDCPCEENLIRMKLAEITTIEKLEFDLSGRTLDVLHTGAIEPISSELDSLNLGSHLVGSVEEKGEVTAEMIPGNEKYYGLYLLLISVSFL